MSTLEVACDRCDKRFRVRPEFAGKSTRCPGCSAPITIGGVPRLPDHREERVERPRERPRPRDDDDHEPRRPVGNWRPVAAAAGREQVAVVFVLMTILGSYLVFCLSSAFGRSSGPMEGVVVGLMLLLLVGPSLLAAVFALMARAAALSTPPGSLAKGSAVASLLCALGGLVALVVLGIATLASFDSQRPSELPMVVAMVGLALATLGAVGTFLGFIAQVGIARRSAGISRAVGRMAVACGVCILILLGIGLMYALISEIAEEGPSGSLRHTPSRDDGPFFQIVSGVLVPMAVAVTLILYHRLLGATRRAIQADSGEPFKG